MKKAVKFWYVKAVSCTKIDKDHLILMEMHERILKVVKHVSCVAWELGKVKKIKESMHSLNNA